MWKSQVLQPYVAHLSSNQCRGATRDTSSTCNNLSPQTVVQKMTLHICLADKKDCHQASAIIFGRVYNHEPTILKHLRASTPCMLPSGERSDTNAP